MTSRELVIKTLNHQPVDRAPRDLWVVPGVEMFRPDELTEVHLRFPGDIVAPDFKYPVGRRSKGKPYQIGRYTDAWGCTWQVAQRGLPGEVKQSPLADLSRLAEYKPPTELLESAKFNKVNRSCATTSRFVLAMTDVRPFERLQFLRGVEATYVDLAYGTKEIRTLLATLHDFYCQELEMWAKTDVDGVAFSDDWGSQTSLLVSPELWRDLFRPLYREYCKILHAKDKFAFFHCDGNIADIFGDLVRLGLDAINAQLFAMNLERLAKRYRGRITFWGEIDRQRILAFGSLEEIRQAVLRVRRALDFGCGGVIAQCEWGLDVPWRNIASVFEQWMAPLPVHV